MLRYGRSQSQQSRLGTALQCRLTKTARLLHAASMRGAWAKARQGMARAAIPLSTPPACPALLEYASRFPPPPRHSLPTTTTHHHSPLTLSPPPQPPLTAYSPRRRERYPPASFSAAVQNGQRLPQARASRVPASPQGEHIATT